MKRLMVLAVGCLILGLGSTTDVFGQKKKNDVEPPTLAELPGLIEQLKSKDADARAKAAKRLGDRAQVRARDIKPAVSTLVEMVKNDKDTAPRAAAAQTLGYANLEPEMGVPLLVGILKEDKELSVKTAAASALGYFGRDGKDAIPALQEAQAMAKGADKTEKDKQALGKAAGAAINMINEKAKKK
jgi:HEAT repeat protein